MMMRISTQLRYARAAAALAAIATTMYACRSSASASATAEAGTVAVRLERGPCFGRCPEYVVEILDDGTVRFEGKKNVASTGAKRSTIAVTAVRALQQQFTTAGFAALDSAYVEGAKGCGRYLPDGPRTVLGARGSTSMKSVQHDAGCTSAPRVLQTLAAQVDSVARTSAWVTGTGGSK
jgi:Domain of unknown function (DUF6438)